MSDPVPLYISYLALWISVLALVRALTLPRPKPSLPKPIVLVCQYVGEQPLHRGQLVSIGENHGRAVTVTDEESEMFVGAALQDCPAGPQNIAVSTPSGSPTALVISAEPFEIGARLYLSSAGRVAAHGTIHCGFALTAAGAPDHIVEMLWR